MTDLKRNEARRRESHVENDNWTRKAGHLHTDAELGNETVPADEETEGATNALEAPPLPPEMAKDGKTDRI
ncbi:hypothetical protein DEM27_22020 [Metarhizobium album]|uniref:Uncharacterized protein n=1 Tax=Metarhizobium album TaxID=2182425 RepID=A0A2U2DL19_9HYPH|nr:hypothetical protein [Rhizobium album]PWE54007.1 hypothetical protein DEM27_22020 [Rhizobium album]